jgi:3,4-dihydroxy 2-butanone 4-phosphate synthase/GTP cyclohydrolase II
METKIIEWIRHYQDEYTRKKINRPLVTLAYAQSIDGSLTIKQGFPTQISGERSSVLTHQIRSIHDGIMIGSGTLLADNPKLNVRHVVGPTPIPILLDSQLKIPLDAKVVNSNTRSIIFCSDAANSEKKKLLLNRNVIINSLALNDDGLLPLKEILEILFEMNFSNVMVEGGPKLINSYIQQELWDLAVISIAPIWLGGYGLNQFRFDRRFPIKHIKSVLNDEDIILFGSRE